MSWKILTIKFFPLKSVPRDLIQPFSKRLSYKRKKSILPYHNNIPLFFELTGKLTQTSLKQRTNIYHQNLYLGQRKGFKSTLAAKERFPFSTDGFRLLDHKKNALTCSLSQKKNVERLNVLYPGNRKPFSFLGKTAFSVKLISLYIRSQNYFGYLYSTTLPINLYQYLTLPSHFQETLGLGKGR